MTIYFAGVESDTAQLHSKAISEAGGFDSDFARHAVIVQQGGDANIDFLGEHGAASASGYWFHTQYRYDNTAYADFNHWLVFIRTSSGEGSCLIDLDASGYLVVRAYGASDAYTASASSTNRVDVNGAVNHLDVHVYTSGGNAVADLYLNRVLECTATHTGSSNQGASYAILENGRADVANTSYYSELVLADEDTRGWRVKTLVPSADGTHTDWSGTYTDISAVESLGGIQATAVGDLYSYQTAGLSAPASTYLIKAVCVNARCSSNGTNDLQMFLRKGGTDYFGSDLSVGIESVGYTTVWENDPSTGSPWTGDNLSTVEFGFKAVT